MRQIILMISPQVGVIVSLLYSVYATKVARQASSSSKLHRVNKVLC